MKRHAVREFVMRVDAISFYFVSRHALGRSKNFSIKIDNFYHNFVVWVGCYVW